MRTGLAALLLAVLLLAGFLPVGKLPAVGQLLDPANGVWATARGNRQTHDDGYVQH